MCKNPTLIISFHMNNDSSHQFQAPRQQRGNIFFILRCLSKNSLYLSKFQNSQYTDPFDSCRFHFLRQADYRCAHEKLCIRRQCKKKKKKSKLLLHTFNAKFITAPSNNKYFIALFRAHLLLPRITIMHK